MEILAKLGKVLFIVGDPRQKIYDSADCFDMLGKVTQKVHQLHYNYRCGRKICKFADLLAKDSDEYEPLSTKSQYDEASKPSSVESVACKDINSEAKTIIQQLSTQLKAYPDELLGQLACSLRFAANRNSPRTHQSPDGLRYILKESRTAIGDRFLLCLCRMRISHHQ